MSKQVQFLENRHYCFNTLFLVLYRNKQKTHTQITMKSVLLHIKG